MSNITESFVKTLAIEAKQLVATSKANEVTRKYWNDKLDNVTLKTWAINPLGYILKGLSPYARRAKSDTVAQFLTGLELQLTATLEQQARKPDSQLARKLIEKGNFYSAARDDSQYGSKESREQGHKVAHTVATVKDRRIGAALIQDLENSLQGHLNAKAFETSVTLDMLVQKYSKKPEVVKPEVVKPEVVKPEVVKPEATKKARKA